MHFSGIQKQNVEVVERLFGLSLIMWMESKRYKDEPCISELSITEDVLVMKRD